MGFLDKLKSKTETKVADRASDKIVNAIFGKKKAEVEQGVNDAELEAERARQESMAAQQQALEERQRQLDEQQRELAQAQMAQQSQAQVTYVQGGQAPAATQEQMNAAMGIMYNTKRCPSCQAVCVNSPVECPYCHADLKNVKPMTPEELEALE